MPQGISELGSLNISILRELFRNLPAFRATYREHGIDELHGPDGITINLWDLEYLLSQIHRLPSRQAQAIKLFLVEGHKETTVAAMMGVSSTNPIGMYATSGLQRLLALIADGQLERFKPEESWFEVYDKPRDPSPVNPRFRRFAEIVGFLKSPMQVVG